MSFERTQSAIVAGRQRAASIEIERARLSGCMRAVLTMTNHDGLRAIVATEMERVLGQHQNGPEWVG